MNKLNLFFLAIQIRKILTINKTPKSHIPSYPNLWKLVSIHHPNNEPHIPKHLPNPLGSSLSHQILSESSIPKTSVVKGRFPLLPIILAIFMVFIYTCVAQDNDSLGVSDSLALNNSLSWDDDLSLVGEIDKTTLAQNDTLTFTATVLLSGNPMAYKIENIEPPKITNLDLLISSSSNKTAMEDGVKQYYRTYVFKYIPKTMGMAYLNPASLKIEYLPTGQERLLRTVRMEIEVTQPILPKESKLLWFILIPIALLLLGAIIFFIRKKQKNQKIIEVPEIPLEIESLENLLAVKPFLTKGDFPTFYEKSQAIIKDYIAKKWDIPARSISSDEIIKKLDDAGLSTKILKELSESFSICDRIRFAREQTNESEAHKVFSCFERLLQSFKPNENQK